VLTVTPSIAGWFITVFMKWVLFGSFCGGNTTYTWVNWPEDGGGVVVEELLEPPQPVKSPTSTQIASASDKDKSVPLLSIGRWSSLTSSQNDRRVTVTDDDLTITVGTGPKTVSCDVSWCATVSGSRCLRPQPRDFFSVSLSRDRGISFSTLNPGDSPEPLRPA